MAGPCSIPTAKARVACSHHKRGCPRSTRLEAHAAVRSCRLRGSPAVPGAPRQTRSRSPDPAQPAARFARATREHATDFEAALGRHNPIYRRLRQKGSINSLVLHQVRPSSGMAVGTSGLTPS